MHFILDGDPGHDDMLTIFLAAKYVDVIGVTTVYGNSSLENTTRNALKCLELGGLQHIPVAAGLSRPFVGEPTYPVEIHGESGLDGAELPDPTIGTVSTHAVDFIIEASKEYDDLVIVATAALTNVAAAIIKDPTITGRLKYISIMGGSTTGGNQTPAAELNIWLDPEAADVVFTSGVPLKMFGLNVTRQASATRDEIDRIRGIGTPFARTVADLVEFYRASLENVFGLAGASLHDPLAVAVFIKPELFELKPMHVEVELHGTRTRGMTVCDNRHATRTGADIGGGNPLKRGKKPNCEVAVAMDVPGFFDLLNEALAQY